jgi:hypothetical protein
MPPVLIHNYMLTWVQELLLAALKDIFTQHSKNAEEAIAGSAL